MNVIIVPETTLQAFRLFSLVFSAAKSKHPSVTIFYLLFVLFTVGISSFFWKGYGFLIITWGGIVWLLFATCAAILSACRLSKLNAGSLMGQSLLQEPKYGLHVQNGLISIGFHPRWAFKRVGDSPEFSQRNVALHWQVRAQARRALWCSVRESDGSNGCCTGRGSRDRVNMRKHTFEMLLSIPQCCAIWE